MFFTSPNIRIQMIDIISICPKLILIIKKCFYFLKAYSSVVERTAHNGFVVGSNPARPIF